MPTLPQPTVEDCEVELLKISLETISLNYPYISDDNKSDIFEKAVSHYYLQLGLNETSEKATKLAITFYENSIKKSNRKQKRSTSIGAIIIAVISIFIIITITITRI